MSHAICTFAIYTLLQLARPRKPALLENNPALSCNKGWLLNYKENLEKSGQNICISQENFVPLYHKNDTLRAAA